MTSLRRRLSVTLALVLLAAGALLAVSLQDFPRLRHRPTQRSLR